MYTNFCPNTGTQAFLASFPSLPHLQFLIAYRKLSNTAGVHKEGLEMRPGLLTSAFCCLLVGEGLVMLVTCSDAHGCMLVGDMGCVACIIILWGGGRKPNSRETNAFPPTFPNETLVTRGTFLCTAMAGFLNQRNITTTAQYGQAASY